MAVIISANLDFKIIAIMHDQSSMFVFVLGLLNGSKEIIAGSHHAANIKQCDFLNKSLNRLMSFSKGEVILGGYLPVNMCRVSLADLDGCKNMKLALRGKIKNGKVNIISCIHFVDGALMSGVKSSLLILVSPSILTALVHNATVTGVKH